MNDPLIAVAAWTAAAVTVIATAVRAVLVVYRAAVTIHDVHELLAILSPGDAATGRPAGELYADIQEMKSQLSPNGGMSLFDKVAALADGHAELVADLEAQREDVLRIREDLERPTTMRTRSFDPPFGTPI